MFVFVYADNNSALTEKRKLALRQEIAKCIEAGYTEFMLCITNEFCLEARRYIEEKKKVNTDLNPSIYYKSYVKTAFAEFSPNPPPYDLPYIEDYEYTLAGNCDYLICLIDHNKLAEYEVFLAGVKNYKNLF